MNEQATLFDITPEGTELPIAQRKITTGCLLPIASNQVIDINRVCSILDVSGQTIHKLIRLGKLNGYQIGKAKHWMIHYGSIVTFCDELRLTYSIADRRSRLAAGKRWRDAELLPFPVSDTITVKEVMKGLDITKGAALGLIEEGAFESYRLIPYAPWRISKISLFAYADRLKAQMNGGSARGSIAPLRRPQ